MGLSADAWAQACSFSPHPYPLSTVFTQGTPHGATAFSEKLPVTGVDIGKSETRHTSAAEIANFFKACIADTSRVGFIATFNHLAHTKAIGGEIAPEIRAAIKVLFCCGHALPNPQVLAAHLCSIGIADMGDRFVGSVMDAPMTPASEAMQAWTLALRNA